MNKLEAYQCPNCGGHINPARMICEYCGTRFKHQDNVPHLVIDHCYKKPETLVCDISVDKDRIRCGLDDSVSELVRMRIRDSIAEALTPYIDFKSCDDILHDRVVIRGTVRVLPHDYRF